MMVWCCAAGYYRNMAAKRDWYYPTGTLPNGTEIYDTCIGYGDANYKRPIAKFVPKAFTAMERGGPGEVVIDPATTCLMIAK